MSYEKFDEFMNRAIPFTLVASMWFLFLLIPFSLFLVGKCD